jgi:hypothetical protein
MVVMSEIIKIRKDYGKLFARNLDGRYLDADDLGKLIAGLEKTYRRMLETGESQREIFAAAQGDADAYQIAACLVRSKGELPDAYLSYDRGQYRKPSEMRFAGVYVLAHVSRPGQVKIGLSTDLYARTNGLYRDLNRDRAEAVPVEIIALLEANDMDALEAALHRKFEAVRVDSEWFQREPVERWLREVAP